MAVRFDDDEKPEVSLTSMMDCIFILLVFFIVTSHMTKVEVEQELPIELPEAQATVDVDDGKEPPLVTISVTADGEYYVNGKPVGTIALREALTEKAKDFGLAAAVDDAATLQKPVRVRIDGDMYAPFRAIVQVLDVCQQQGLTVVGIHTAALKDLKREKKK